MTETFADGRLILTPGRIARLTLNAPASKNAISRAMWTALPEIAARLAADPATRVLIVTGAGGAFSAGADISEFEQTYATPDSAAATNAIVRAGQQAIRDLPLPVIAMIEGACVGGGCGLALSCDLRFAADTSFFAITPARLGIAYSAADTWALMEKVGPAKAKDILFSARRLPAAEALSIGLIDRALPADQLVPETESYAEALAQLSPASHRVTKATVNALSFPPDTPHLTRAFEALFTGPDFAEGRAAFLAKRKPAFQTP
jgi:enoyl-CoA hydratase/carnithine racemase